MKIFIDYDDVLFNTKKFKEDYFKIFKKKGVSRKIFDECYFDPLDDKTIKNYDPIGHIRRVCKKIKIDADSFYEEIQAFTSDTEKYVFSDVADFIDKHRKKELAIISFSATNFQKSKIYNSGIAKFFDKIKIVDSLKGEALLKMISKEKIGPKEKLYFIDDRIEQIESVKRKCSRVKTVLIVRKEGRYRDRRNSYCDFRVSNLKAVEKIIKQNGK